MEKYPDSWMVYVDYLDCADWIGLSIGRTNSNNNFKWRQAVRFPRQGPKEQVVASLRALADWIEAKKD